MQPTEAYVSSSSQPGFNIGSYDGGLETNLEAVHDDPDSVAKHRQFDQDFQCAGPSDHWNLGNFDIGRPLGKDERSRHPNIIRLYGWFHDATRIFLMMEYAGRGELYRQLAKNGRFSERRSGRYVRQVADGLAYLHENQVIHRDIKPENLLIGMNGEIKIGDFGWSVYSPVENSQRTLAGTLSYVAPEMILGQPYGKGVDIWALGVLTFELVCGEEPFGADTTKGPRLVHSRICRCDIRFPDFVSQGARSFILQLLRVKPADRLSLNRVSEEHWIRDSL
ncbi:hypothetical protein IAR55_001198 [Kwoniella newhampshirensis]|uniref:Protein kinase domain-containing protein n=1 Tax=Kwoniella newhampshirensis TaxID=1651941 RepID=A0AAW0Z5H8_9TREE